MRKPTFKEAAELGFVFPQGRAWIDGNVPALAQDAALITAANSGIPVEFVSYIDPMVIEILTAPRMAKAIFEETKKGDWTTAYEKWRVDEVVGSTQPYTDYQEGTTSDVNSNWLAREQYVFQSTIKYGDREIDMAAQARIELASAKQRAVATIIDIDSNRFYLFGVKDREIYGILNDPNLPVAETSLGWEDSNTHKVTSQEIYEEIRTKLFGPLAERSAGHITNSTPLKLLLSPTMHVKLGMATDFNVSVLDMLNKFFSNLEIIVVPELGSLREAGSFNGSDAGSGEYAFLIAPEVNGMPTGQLAFGEKFRLGRLVSEMSSYRQKAVCTTYGGLVLQPFAFAILTGMEAQRA